MRKLVLFILMVLTISYKKEVLINDTIFTEYTISHHKSTNNIQKIKSHSIDGKAMFSKSCEYVLTENIGQINKLTGLSNGLDHQKNSIRIGWVYENGAFDLYCYAYYNSERIEQKLTSVLTDEIFTFKIWIDLSGYHIILNGVQTDINAPFDELDSSYLLYPYFGGKEPFPNSIHGDKECKIYLQIN